MRGQSRKQECDKAGHPLKSCHQSSKAFLTFMHFYLECKEDDGDQAHPGVEAVQVGNGTRLCGIIFAVIQVVRIEDRDQRDHREE